MTEREHSERMARAILVKSGFEGEALEAKIKEIVNDVFGPEQSAGFRFGRWLHKAWKYLAGLISMTVAVVGVGAIIGAMVEFFNLGYDFARELLPW